MADAWRCPQNCDVRVPFSVFGLWELHGSSCCTSESQASAVRRTGTVGCCIATRTPKILTMYGICGNFQVFRASESHALAFHHNGHPHNLVHEQSLWKLSDLLDFQDDRHCPCTTWMISAVSGIFSMCGICLCVHQRNDRHCRLHCWEWFTTRSHLLEADSEYSLCSTWTVGTCLHGHSVIDPLLVGLILRRPRCFLSSQQ